MKRGEGEYITMPIKILNTPFLGKTDEPFRVPEQWDPFQCNHKQVPVQMDTEDGLSEYFKTVTRPRWKKWHGRMTDLEKKLEDALFLTLEKEKQAKEKHDEASRDKEETKQPTKAVKPKPGGIPPGGKTGSEVRVTDKELKAAKAGLPIAAVVAAEATKSAVKETTPVLQEKAQEQDQVQAQAPA